MVLLTGATGFVGRQILKALAAQPVDVRLIVREGKQSAIEQTNRIESVVTTQDIFSETSDWLSRVCKDVDIVIHAAWYAEPGKYLQSPKNIDCLKGTLTLAEACVKAGIRRFVGIGTCFEYDLSTGYLSVDTPLRPATPYAAAKAAAFFVLSQYFEGRDIEFAWCRLFYLYGEREDERRLVPYLRKQFSQGKVAELTSGRQVRDYLDVCEAGSMIAKIASNDFVGPINVCSGIPVTVRQIAEQIADEYGRRDLLCFGKHPERENDPPVVVGV